MQRTVSSLRFFPIPRYVECSALRHCQHPKNDIHCKVCQRVSRAPGPLKISIDIFSIFPDFGVFRWWGIPLFVGIADGTRYRGGLMLLGMPTNPQKPAARAQLEAPTGVRCNDGIGALAALYPPSLYDEIRRFCL